MIEGDKKIGNAIGRLGEDIACVYLEKQKYVVQARNYRKKWGEIDIIASKEGIIHFVEVKAVSREISKKLVSGETYDKYRAEDNLHHWKLERLRRTIQTYMAGKNISPETKWCFDAITIMLDMNTKKAAVRFIKDT